jgi:AcrR family transcriptional regulator
MKDKSTFIKMREDERELRKTLIINAALKLFQQADFKDIGMRDIADEAGISAASLYRYFSSRDDIFAEALIRDIIIIEQQFEMQMEEGTLTIETFAVEVIDYLLNNEASCQMFTHFMIKGSVDKKIIKKFNTVQRYYLRLVDQVLINVGLKNDVRYFSHSFSAALIGIVLTFRNDINRTHDEINTHMKKLGILLASLYKSGIEQV